MPQGKRNRNEVTKMCNIAGYVGTKDAAPILIEMIRRQEGFAGGYYTGIATLHEGKIYYAKLTGTADRLVSLTDAAKLPGKIGIIHSRSKAGGGDEWAHPFIGWDRHSGNARIAYIANGSKGIFKSRAAEADAIAQRLFDEGYRMDSRVRGVSDRYTTLSDGTQVHMSDVMCQYILENMDGGLDSPAAFERAYCTMPAELVGLLLDVDQPDCIVWSRLNCPLHLGFTSHGAYLSSSPMGFPEDPDVKAAIPMPHASAGRVFADRFESKKYDEQPAKVGALYADRVFEAYGNVQRSLEEGEKTFSELCKEAVAPVFSKVRCRQTPMLCYEVLEAMYKRKLLNIESREVPGEFPDIPAVKFYMTLNK